MSLPLYITGTGICCAVGHRAPAAVSAIRAGMNNFRETHFVDESGRPLIGSMLHEVTVWGQERLRLMFDAVLHECLGQSQTEEYSSVALILICADRHRSARFAAYATDMLSAGMHRYGLAEESSVLPTGKAGVSQAVRMASQLLADCRDLSHVIICGVDSFFDAASVEALLAEERLATRHNVDGFIPGEAAAAIAVALQPEQDKCLRIDGVGMARDTSTIGSDTPTLGIGLSRAIRAAVLDANCRVADLASHASGCSGESWYFREAGLALGRTLETRVQAFPHWLVCQSVGEVGAACGPIALAWLADVMRREDGPGSGVLAHFSNDDGQRAALVLRLEETGCHQHEKYARNA